ncbi:Succinyl-diaminopimelate desuccinylase [Pseudoruegeria aquimaris]|uniref:Succinyl-diaminopimelate desuccinylase n=1 Tax=Pseudoruegeria aquimaris TaxID=393663 RepID=A0A1Y5S2T9_9RHOB|nr:M20 family peptidase [Pseudoruegeria aquimaris]SLN28703.1 Succinyl-diaminopimelate desuccinylase [Pseudoruegeria aquimaris]
MIRRIGIGLGGALLALGVVLAVNTLRYAPEAVATAARVSTPTAVDGTRLAAQLAEAVRLRTVAPAERNRAEFEAFIALLERSFPRANEVMERELINGLTPLYRWQGRNPDLAPVLLTGHYDVVPAWDADPAGWEHPPFAGEIADGFVWGRGTLDDKGAILAMMAAAEGLAAEGFQPERTLYFSFGHDEETGGRMGAAAVVAHLQAQGVRLAWSLDEGSMVLRGMVPGLKQDVASINVAEKGYMTVDLVASAAGGHSSLPPRETAVGILAAGIAKLQEKPFPGGLTDVSADFFDGLGPHFGFPEKLVFANQWLFRPVLESQLGGSEGTDAMLRTTVAPTMLAGSDTENVLPQEAVATVNFRIHPRDTVESVLAYVQAVVDDPRIEIRPREGARGASTVSSAQSEAFGLLSASFRAVFGDVAVVPGLTVAATDSAHYQAVAEDSYRINPFVFEPHDLPRIHGVNERVSLENLEKAVQFYRIVMEGA